MNLSQVSGFTNSPCSNSCSPCEEATVSHRVCLESRHHEQSVMGCTVFHHGQGNGLVSTQAYSFSTGGIQDPNLE